MITKNFSQIKKCSAILAGLFLVFFVTACGDNSGGDDGNNLSVPEAAVITTGDCQLVLTWDAVEGATSYEVWYSETNNFSLVTQDGADITGTSYTITGLSNDTTYYVWLKAKNSKGTSDFGSVASGSTQDTTAPPKIVLNSLTTGPGSISFSWTDPSEGNFDHVEITCGGSTEKVTKGTETYTKNDLTASTAYTVTVKAADSEGNLSEENTIIVKTLESGSDDTEYLKIYTAEDLNEVRVGLNKNYILMADIDLSESSYSSGWTPLGDIKTYFTGTFLGNGHVIRNLFINTASSNYQGLFGRVGSGGSIQSLGLEDVNITGKDSVGGLVGDNYNGTISNCYATGTVTGDFSVGGLVGYSYEAEILNCYATGTVTGKGLSIGGLAGYNYKGTISNSYATGTVNGDGYVGGLVGDNSYGTVSNSYATSTVNGGCFVGGLAGYNYEGETSNCYATGTVNGNEQVGGLVGFNVASGNISNSYATGAVTGNEQVGGLVGSIETGTILNSYATGTVNGNEQVGGLVGFNSASGKISNSYATGAVTGNEQVGGLVGYIETGTILNSYATGAVTGNEQVGGLVGYIETGTISNSYATGTVNGDYCVGGLVGFIETGTISNSYAIGTVNGKGSVGGLVGSTVSGTVSSCFYDRETTGQNDNGIGMPLDTEEMKTQSTFTGVGWDFIGETVNGENDYWSIDSLVNSGYPCLTGLADSY